MLPVDLITSGASFLLQEMRRTKKKRLQKQSDLLTPNKRTFLVNVARFAIFHRSFFDVCDAIFKIYRKLELVVDDYFPSFIDEAPFRAFV
jgi:hypothetical protein